MSRISESADQGTREGAAQAVPSSHEQAPQDDLWVITTGCWRTRRKTYCYVTDPSGEVRFAARRFWPCVAFLDEIEVDLYMIRPDDDEGDASPAIIVDRSKDRTWQK